MSNLGVIIAKKDGAETDQEDGQTYLGGQTE